jgi:hypothetical protein
MTRRSVWFVAASVVVLSVAVGVVSVYSLYYERPAADPAKDFTVSVRADADLYSEGETVLIVMKVCSRRVWWRVVSRSPFHWQIVDSDGNAVADTSHRVYQLVYIPQPWAPRQCRTWHDEWDQHYWNQAERRSFAEPVRGERVPAGEFQVRATWAAISGRDSPPLSKHPPVKSPPFTIEP